MHGMDGMAWHGRCAPPNPHGLIFPDGTKGGGVHGLCRAALCCCYAMSRCALDVLSDVVAGWSLPCAVAMCRHNPEILPGRTIVVGTQEGVYATARRSDQLVLVVTATSHDGRVHGPKELSLEPKALLAGGAVVCVCVCTCDCVGVTV